MKRALITLLVILIVLAVAGWLLYPVIANQISQGQNGEQIQAYDSAVRKMTSDQITESFRQAEEYNTMFAGSNIQDDFAKDRFNVPRKYLNTLNIQDGMIGELVITRIGVSLPIYHTGNGNSVQEKLIHVEGSALPADQDGTHIVLAGPGVQKAPGILGSLALTGARMLEDLDKIVPDDLIYLRVMDRTMVFQVNDVRTVTPDGLTSMDFSAEEDSRMLTLITERKGNRLMISARQVSVADVKGELAAEDQAVIPSDIGNILFMAIPVILAGILLIFIIEQFRRLQYRLPTERRKAKSTEELEIPPIPERNEALR